MPLHNRFIYFANPTDTNDAGTDIKPGGDPLGTPVSDGPVSTGDGMKGDGTPEN